MFSIFNFILLNTISTAAGASSLASQMNLFITNILCLLFQSLLRGRFLRTERTAEDERPPSVAANELDQLRQRNTVTGLRCAHLSFCVVFLSTV